MATQTARALVAFGEEQFEDHAPVVAQSLGVGAHLHAFGDAGDAGGEELVQAGDFDDADAAGADVGESFEMAEG